MSASLLVEPPRLGRLHTLRSWLSTPSDPERVNEHRATVLLRTRVAAWIAAFVMPTTIFAYAASMLQLTGGSAQSDFLFPYSLVLFGIAALFPARFMWMIAAVSMAPVTFLIRTRLHRVT